jgi:hypothetical protein
MGLPRKESRHLVIDGARYRWRLTHASIGWREGLWCPVLLAVESAEAQGQRLYASFESEAHGIPKERAVTPRVVRAIVLAARRQGWQPSAPGLKPFCIQGLPFLEAPPTP